MMKLKSLYIPGFKYFVEISPCGKYIYCDGRLRKQTLNKKKADRKGSYKITIGSKGYASHRLVAMAYVPNPDPENFKIVIHIDSNTLNNHYKNLKWGTKKQSLENSIKNGLNVCKGNVSKHRNPKRKVSLEDIQVIARKLEKGYMVKELCEEYSISHATVNRIRIKYTDLKRLSPRYSKEIKDKARELLEKGNPEKYVSVLMGIRYETILKWSKSFGTWI